MTKPGFAQLEDVIADADFPELDLALRRGRHVDRDDAVLYALLSDAQQHLEAFYQRYGCELIHKSDGYFYLLPTGDKLPRRQLSASDMLVGQALALLYLDPAALERGGLIGAEELIAQLSSVLGSDALIRAFNPKRKRYDERVAHKNARMRIAEAVRRLATLGFVELVESERYRLRPALLRFAEPVRGLAEPAETLAKLAARGEITFEPDAADGGDANRDAADGGDPETIDETETDHSESDTEIADDADSESTAERIDAAENSKPNFEAVVGSADAVDGGDETEHGHVGDDDEAHA
jgi:chromosome partition protein MukE